jgi:hypothetical protein
MKCPYCAHDNDINDRACRHCGAALVKRCPECGATVGVLTAACPACGGNFTGKPAPGPAAAPAAARSGIRCLGPVPPERGMVLNVLLTFFTCGLWALVWAYQIGQDINEHARTQKVNPGMDVLLAIVTCGLWGFYILWRYPDALAEIERDEGTQPNDLALVCLLLGIANMFTGVTLLVALAILQDALHKHWRLHGRAA